MTSSLNTFPSINNHLRPINERPLVTRQVKAHIGNVHRIRQPAQRHIPDEFLPVLLCIFHAREHAEQPCTRQQRRNGVYADIVRAVFRREAFCCLYTQLARLAIQRPNGGWIDVRRGVLTFETAPLLALYHTSPGRGLLAPVEETLITLPPFPCSRSLAMTACEPWKMLLTLTLKTRSHSASVTSRVGYTS